MAKAPVKKKAKKSATTNKKPGKRARKRATKRAGSAWEVSGFKARITGQRYVFDYQRSNTRDGAIQIVYATAMGGDPIQGLPPNEIVDDGTAASSGPQNWYTTYPTISKSYRIALELWENGILRAKASTELQ